MQFDCADPVERHAGLASGARVVEDGGLVVLPTDTVYGIGADAFNADAVMRLLAAKGRGRQSPPPVLIAALADLDTLAEDAPLASILGAALWPGALTIVCRARPELTWDLGETGGTVALRVPAEPIALDFLAKTGPLAVSSANISGAAPAMTAQEARRQFGESVSVYLDGGVSAGGVPSTIVDVARGGLRVLREGAIPISTLSRVAKGHYDGEIGMGV